MNNPRKKQIIMYSLSGNLKKTGRNQFIDVARGISVICIVLGHLSQSGINRVVFTFHVPIFFLITGFFLNANEPIHSFIKKRFRTLIVPYIVCCVIICILALLFNQITNNGDGDKALLVRWIYASLYGAGDHYTEPFPIVGIGAIWFLWATFWGSLFLQFLFKRRPISRVLSVAVIFFFSVWSRRICWFPLSIQAGGTALLFMYIGHLGKEIIPLLNKLKRETQGALIVLVFWIWFSFIRDFQSFWLVHCDYGRGVIDIIGSLCGCCCILLLSYLICLKRNIIANALSYLGTYSLLVLSTHIIELDTFPWWSIGKAIFGEMTDAQFLWIRIIGKFLWIIPATFFLSKWKISRKIWGYQVKE